MVNYQERSVASIDYDERELGEGFSIIISDRMVFPTAFSSVITADTMDYTELP